MLQINVLGGLYVTGDGRALSGAAAQPRRLALLALLAVAGDRGMTRDGLISFLWPDADEERGRRALTQALYALRRDLGAEDALLGLKDLRLNPDLVTSDLEIFRQAVARGDLERAVECCRGPFLDGFNLPGADRFERWTEEQRTTLGHDYRDLLDRLAKRCRDNGDLRAETTWLRRLAAQDPLSGPVALRLMRSLADGGDAAAALQHARVYESLVRQELELPPDPAVLELAERLRRGTPRSSDRTEVAAGEIGEGTDAPAPLEPKSRAPSMAVSPEAVRSSGAAVQRLDLRHDPLVGDPAHTTGWAAVQLAPGRASIRVPRPIEPDSPSRRPILWIASLIVVIASVLIARWFVPSTGAARPGPEERVRTVAVGRIAHYARGGAGPLGQPLADMLATNLARVSGLRVISHVRMLEVMRQVGARLDTTLMAAAAARQAGATELIDGSLYDVAPGVLRLDLTRVDLATGAVIEAYTVQGADLFSIADSGTARLAGDLGGRRPSSSLAEVTTRSLAAYRSYEEGVRAFYQGDVVYAEKLFSRALAEDSAFAMAAYYFALSLKAGPRAEMFGRMSRAIALAEGASDRERLLIRANWAFFNSSPALQAIADTLTVRYPAELEGHLWAGQAALLAGEYERAHAPLRRVIEQDSLGLRGQSIRCLACDAFAALVVSYQEEDSLEAAVRVAREWTRLEPGGRRGWVTLAEMLAQSGRSTDAFAALRVADSLDPRTEDGWRSLVALYMWADRFREAEELARSETGTGPPAERHEGYWLLAIALRHQGRLKEALDAARQYRAAVAEPATPGSAPSTALLEAQVLLESGQFRQAAALFDSIGRHTLGLTEPAVIARHRVWTWTHMAGALAAAGDTVSLASLADSIQFLGQRSAFGRDQRLHFYVRGLLERARGAHDMAATDFQAAISSPNMGYTRINDALAGELLALHRPREAAATMQSAMRGVFEGSNLYLTHTEAAGRLAEAFEAAGRRDSAAFYYAKVAKAWEKADGALMPRLLEARQKSMQLLDRR